MSREVAGGGDGLPAGSSAGTARSSVLQERRVRLARMLCVSFLWNAMTYLPYALIGAYYKELYVQYPPAFFYVRWGVQLGPAGNAVSKFCSDFYVKL